MSENLERNITEDETIEVSELAEEAIEKPYTLRKVNDEDLYTVIEIVGAVLPDDAKEAFAQAVGDGENKKSLTEIGGMIAFDMFKLILKNFKSVKAEVYGFLSDLSGIPAEDIPKMPFGTTPKMLKEVFQDGENASFFKELFKSIL